VAGGDETVVPGADDDGVDDGVRVLDGYDDQS